MRFPWQHRADNEMAHRLHAEQRLAEAQADWPRVREHAAALREQRELNGWTDAILTIFSGPSPRHEEK